MVKKNKFIDKRNARTYALVYGQEGEGGRVLYEQGQEHGAAVENSTCDRGGHPLSWLMDGESAGERLDEKRRQELIELGFDDDGYDYLQHLRRLDTVEGDVRGHLEEVKTEEKIIVSEKRVIEGSSSSGKKKAAQEGDAGVFVKAPMAQVPEEDVALFDASGLTVMQQADDDEDVTGMMGGVTAFSKKTDDVLERKEYEIGEIESMMRDAERATEEHERVLGDGDLLDDFILAAAGAETHDDIGSEEDWGEDDDSYSSGAEAGSDGDVHHRPGSIASTYWREERQDRKNLLSVIDEQFEHLALEYDEDELGDMEDRAEAIEGVADVSEFDNVLDEFIKDHPKPSTKGGAGLFLAEEMEKYGFGNEHADVAVRMAKEAIRAAEEAENDPNKPVANGHIDVDPSVFDKDRERWDCESILSLRSNIYNHPGTITEPGISKAPKTIALNKDGLPVGYVPTGRDLVSVKPSADEEAYSLRPKTVVQQIRKKDESAEEKRARKAAVKAAKREARATKKEFKVLFSKEKQKASKRDAQAPVQPSVIM